MKRFVCVAVVWLALLGAAVLWIVQFGNSQETEAPSFIEIRVHNVISVAFSPDEKKVITTSLDEDRLIKTTHTFDVKSGKELEKISLTIDKDNSNTQVIVFSPDKKSILRQTVNTLCREIKTLSEFSMPIQKMNCKIG